MKEENLVFEGKNAVLEAFNSNTTIDKLYIQEGMNISSVSKIISNAKKQGTFYSFVKKEILDRMSETKNHQGIIAYGAAFSYSDIDDMLRAAREKNEQPFIIFLDEVEDPHNLGAVIRTANTSGAHGVVITKHRAARITAAAVKTSAGAVNYTPVAKVTNLAAEIELLKKRGMWFVCADMNGEVMYNQNMKGSIGLVLGNEGTGVSRLVRERCDMSASIPMMGEINSLNVSAAAAVLAYEIVRQRRA